MWGRIILGLIAVAIFGNYAYQIVSWLRHPEYIEDGAGSGWTEDESLRNSQR